MTEPADRPVAAPGGLGRGARRARRWAAGQGYEAAGRVRSSLWPVAQMSVAAGVAWLVATRVLGHEAPFFAPIAAVVCLGLGLTQRVRRVAELAVGVTVGVALGEGLAALIGRGAWQIALGVALGLVVARVLGSGGLLATQAAVQSVLVLAIPASPSGAVARWQDALVGGTVALVLALFTPPDPREEAGERARAALDSLIEVLEGAAHAIRTGDAAAAEAVLAAARATGPVLDSWAGAVEAGEEISRLSPVRRRYRGELRRQREALTGVDRAARNARVLVRRVASSLDSGRPVPPGVADLLDELSAALALHGGLIATEDPSAVQAALRTLAGRLDVARGGGSWAGTIALAQLRSIVVDLLTATGMPLREARTLLPPPGPTPP